MLGGVSCDVVEAARVSAVLDNVSKVDVARVGVLRAAPASVVEVADQDLEVAGDEGVHVRGDVEAGGGGVGA